MPKRYWLLKSEPDVFSLDDLKREKKTSWDGIRNYQARNFLREMRKGDEALYYHSRSREVVGTAKVLESAYPDPAQFDAKSKYHDPKSNPDDPRWFAVDVGFGEAFPRPVPLDAIKALAACREMALVRQGRLSVQPVTSAEWAAVRKLARSG